MPLPCSADLRERVLLAYQHGEGTAAGIGATVSAGAQYGEELGAGGRA